MRTIMTENALVVFENYKIRRLFNEQTETWYFSVVDIIAVLLQQPDYKTARKYWNKLKERLKKEGSESVTNCHQLKLEAADGKKYLTDAADPETLLRLIQSVLSPKAESIKLWLAKVGYERLQDMNDPAAQTIHRLRWIKFVYHHYVFGNFCELPKTYSDGILLLDDFNNLKTG